MRQVLLACMALLCLSACKHTPPFTEVGQLCKLQRYSLETPLPDEKPLTSILEGNPGDMLLLSGGSQNGAFGAGFIDGWHKAGNMPEFKLVTGVSTGALQATGAFIGRPDITIDGYTIASEEDLLETYVDGSDIEDGFGFGAISSLLTRGAISDLIPLRTKLAEIFTHDILIEVGKRYDPRGKGAHLLVGVTDVDLGRAVAFDLSELAWRYSSQPEDSPEALRMKTCYIEALVASSTVPPAARPAFIDNRMYLDGGIRYALFDDRLGEILGNMQAGPRTSRDPDAPDPSRPDPGTPDPASPGLYVILNATGNSRAECNKVDQVAHCDPINSIVGRRDDWEPLGLAVRTLELFENQIRRLSVQRAEDRAALGKIPFFFARIKAEELADENRTYAIPDFEGEKSCEAWRADDDADENPLEFHRRYMRCLIEYGRERGQRANWDHSKNN